MKKYLASFQTLTKFELGLWITSMFISLLSFLISGGKDYLNLIASLIGVTALIFVAKGHVLGQLLTVVFAIFYGIISVIFHIRAQKEVPATTPTLPCFIELLILPLRKEVS